ncbi:serine/threonine protein kinase, putative [Theileria annulata]|uniref:Cyclin-dependent kinase 2 homolog n=1 Tax=Theileria annulata TaxID=5874 RepID=Q4U9C6_THEAN|nr:serine/threonine protein kinase, putative [Theileria annulata]CAI76577.1 serine/threonine protein kinase, putative [Theileria annulata]|eukprot:XP_953202.1 serine/threonine protein kinase, putative [Theileria annulata]
MDEEDYLLTPENYGNTSTDIYKKDESSHSKTDDSEPVKSKIAECVTSNNETIVNELSKSYNKSKSECISEFKEAEPNRFILDYKPCRDVECFKCLNKISEGTYGTVYRALEIKTGKIVALKHIKYHDVQWKEGFPLTYLREISILLQLNHPNILSVKEIVTNKKQDQFYMVMEYVEHELKTLLEENRPNFTLSERKCLLKQLLDGINYLHQNWVMHRDLKTTNILYNNSGLVKICDFGMARKFGVPIRKYTHNVVTHWYRAPELFLGEPYYTEKTDVWSIGCIFAELILSRPLFMGTNDADTLDKIFRLCGSPNEENWPGFSKLPGIVSNKFQIHKYNPSFENVFKVGIMGGMVHGSTCMTELGLDLLKKMLNIDPNQRISAKDALNHPYITQEKPRTQAIELMPTVPDTNSTSRTKRRQEKQDNQELESQSRFRGRVDPVKFLSMMKEKKISQR